MAQCETCGNEYDKAFKVVLADVSYTFDSFECAIQALAPTCSHCGCRILGHGVEADGLCIVAHTARANRGRKGARPRLSCGGTLKTHGLGSATGCVDVKAVLTRCSAVASEHPSAWAISGQLGVYIGAELT